MKKIRDKSIDKIKRNGSVEQLSKEESIKINSRIYKGMKAVKRKYVRRENESKMFNIHELILLKQWYHAIEDINIHYLKDYDKTLYNKIKELLGGKK